MKHKKKITNTIGIPKKIIVAFFLVISTGVFGLLYFLTNQHFGANASKQSLEELADEAIARCQSEQNKPVCYDREIPNLMDPPTSISMEDAFVVTRYVQEKDPQYLYCHVLGHKVSSKETKKDPSKWKEILTRCPTTMCNNGCLHGSLMTRFNAEHLTDSQIEELKPDIADVCEPRGNWHPKPVEISMCYHAIGHLNMYITKANIKKSLELCEVVSKKADGRDYRETCTQGVFMQVFQPLEPEDFALVRGSTPTRERLVAFCDQFEELEQKSACFREAWPLFLAEIMNAKTVPQFCSFLDYPKYLRDCYASALSFVTVQLAVTQNNIQKLATYCQDLPTDRRVDCFADAAMRIVQLDPKLTDKAIAFCNTTLNEKEKKACFDMMVTFSLQSFSPETKEVKDYCIRLPTPWRTECLKINKLN